MKIETHEIQSENLRARQILRREICVPALCVFLFLISPAALFCKDLAQYRGEIANAKVLTEELILPDDEEMSPAEFKEYERRKIAQIRAALPPVETIEWQGSTVETDNRWLGEKLDQYEREAQNGAKHAAILMEIVERIGAIEQELDGLEKPSPAASNRTKDEDKQKLAEILRRQEYQKPDEKQESFFARTWRKFMEWLREKFPHPDLPEAPSTDGFQSLSFVLQMLLYAAILSAIGFLIYRFAPSLAQKFKGRERRKKSERVILGERIAADETAENLFSEAERLARAGDLRGAVRKGYIALLCELADRKIIGLARHKTNRDYLRDVRPARADLYENVRGLTADFERHWYGLNAVEEKDWEEFRNEYRKTITN